MITYKIDQGDLNKLRQKLEPAQYQKAIDIALFNIGEQMSREAKEKAPYRKGILRKSIKPEQEKGKVTVGTDLDYARIQELGGAIYPKKGKFLRFEIGGKEIFAKSVTIKAKPYLTPALERQKAGRALDTISQEINRILQ